MRNRCSLPKYTLNVLCLSPLRFMLLLSHHALFLSLFKLILCVTEESCHIKFEIFVSQKSVEKKATALDSWRNFWGEHGFCDKLFWDNETPTTWSTQLASPGGISGQYENELTPMTLANKFCKTILAKDCNQKHSHLISSLWSYVVIYSVPLSL